MQLFLIFMYILKFTASSLPTKTPTMNNIYTYLLNRFSLHTFIRKISNKNVAEIVGVASSTLRSPCVTNYLSVDY